MHVIGLLQVAEFINSTALFSLFQAQTPLVTLQRLLQRNMVGEQALVVVRSSSWLWTIQYNFLKVTDLSPLSLYM